MRPVTLFLLALVNLTQAFARLEKSVCGTYRDRGPEEVHLHRRVNRQRGKSTARAAATAPAARDIGDIAILEDSDGVVARRNEFNLDQRTIQFSPVDPAATR